MKPIIARLTTSLALCLLLSACPETTVSDSFGTAPVRLKEVDWAGNWRPADEVKELFTFRVKDAAQGVLELRETAPKDPKKKPVIFSLTLRQIGTKTDEKLHLAILKDTGKTDDGTPHLIRPSKDGVFILWAIDHEAVTAAIKSGELQGRIIPDKDGPHNSLTADPKNYPQLLSPKFWKWTEPMVMMRVTQS
jgi:hypothetical protein